jgi:hypothetical protein
MTKITAATFGVFLCGIILNYFELPLWVDYFFFASIFGAPISFIVLITSFLDLVLSKSPDYGSGHPKGELKTGHIVASYDQHYISGMKGC